MNIDDVIKILQLSIAPAVLISAVGMLVLSATTRMAVLVDRIRAVSDELAGAGSRAKALETQLAMLLERARVLKFVLISFVLSILMDALVVISLFVFKVVGLDGGAWVVAQFLASLVFLILGLVGFAVEATRNLRALMIEIGHR